MGLTGRDEHERATFDLPTLGTIEEYARAPDDDIHLIPLVRLLWVPILWRVQFGFEGSV